MLIFDLHNIVTSVEILLLLWLFQLKIFFLIIAYLFNLWFLG